MKSRVLIPNTGTDNTVIQRLMDYLFQNSIPKENFIGAHEKLIEQYKVMAKIAEIPLVLLNYWKVFGCNNGGLFNEKLIDTNLEHILDLYQEGLKWGYDLEKFPVFAFYLIGGEISLDIKKNADNPPVLSTDQGEVFEIISSSLELYLMRSAIKYVEKRKRKYGIWFSNSCNSAKKHLPYREGKQSASDEINRLANNLALKKVWVSDPYCQIFMDNNICLFSLIEEENRIMIYLFSDIELDDSTLHNIEVTFGATKGTTHILGT